MKLRFKEEDVVNGEPVGPIAFDREEATGRDAVLGRPFDPNAEPDPWFQRKQATWIAEQLGIELEEE